MGGIIVVSDTHFGYEESNYEQFEHFLHSLKQNRLVAHLHDKTKKEIKNVEKIILLGDIFDIWDPRGDDRKNILINSIISLRELSELGLKIIYIVGNHDEEIDMFNGDYRGKIKIKRYYELPRKKSNGEQGYSYSFMHGHQFDKTFLLLGSLWKMPGYMATINNFWKRIPYVRKSLSYGFYLSIPLILMNWCFHMTSFVYLYALLIASGTVAFPAAWTRFQRPFHTLCGRFLKEPAKSAKHKNIIEILKRGFYKEKKEPDTDVIVYGHTHIPEHLILLDDELTLKKIFINTGSWVKNEEVSCTLAYINTDESEHYLLQWDDKKKQLIEPFPPVHAKWENGSLTILEL